MKYNILLIDDEVAILQMLSSYLQEKYHIKKAINGKTALNFIADNPPDLIITDWMLPDIDGVEIISWVRKNEKYKRIPIITLTAKSSEADKVKAFNAGADDYMVKPLALLELDARITALLRRSLGEKQQIISHKCLTLDSNEQLFYIDEKSIKITGKEFKLLQLLIKNPQRIYTREQIIDSLYTDTTIINDRTIDVLISRVRKILQNNNCNLLQTMRGLGYKLDN